MGAPAEFVKQPVPHVGLANEGQRDRAAVEDEVDTPEHAEDRANEIRLLKLRFTAT